MEARDRRDIVAGKLARLVNSPEVRERCRVIAGRFEGIRPLDRTCDLIEKAGRS